MESIEIQQWAAIESEPWDSLLIGNGASIALSSEFSYKNLHELSEKYGVLSQAANQLFSSFGSHDFEHILLACTHAAQVNQALGSPNPAIKNVYDNVRDALIETVKRAHPIYANKMNELNSIGVFASKFNTIANLNYDVTLYWAILLYNNTHANWFKDAFPNGNFRANWSELRQPFQNTTGATLVFYPHGSIILATNTRGAEIKIQQAGHATLLAAIENQWTQAQCVPLFVSEGTSAEKMRSIRRSYYLSQIYDRGLQELGKKIVIYGWSFSAPDNHILKALMDNKPNKIAVSVYTGESASKQQSYCHDVLAKVAAYDVSTEVIFFDSKSPGCWIY